MLSKVKIDMTNQKFGYLYVLQQADDYVSPSGNKATQWLCRCDCGAEVIVRGRYLRSGHTKSCKKCGNIRAGASCKKPSQFYIVDNVVHIIASKGEEFLVDVVDLDLVKDYCWRSNKLGYAVTDINRKVVRMHRLIMGCLNSEIKVDHKNGLVFDNRRCNLRLVTQEQNNMNRCLSSLNTSGITGVCWDSSRNKWQVHIGVNHKSLFLGRFDTFEEACAVRRSAEEKYFGEYSFTNSRLKPDTIGSD